METETVIIFGEEVKVKRYSNCNGDGFSRDWNRKLQKHVVNKNYHCEICKGGRYIVLPKKK